ncbi:hypothetical protein I4U23_005515 [Adineta vaga]|nr:hypothetical protein I4U23_005515 [Adineta vaga]
MPQAVALFPNCGFDDTDCCAGCTCRYGIPPNDVPYSSVASPAHYRDPKYYAAFINGGVCRGNNGNRSCPICVRSGDNCSVDGLDCCYGSCVNGRCTRIADVCYGNGGSCFDFDNNCIIGSNYACYDFNRRVGVYPINIPCCPTNYYRDYIPARNPTGALIYEAYCNAGPGDGSDAPPFPNYSGEVGYCKFKYF